MCLEVETIKSPQRTGTSYDFLYLILVKLVWSYENVIQFLIIFYPTQEAQQKLSNCVY